MTREELKAEKFALDAQWINYKEEEPPFGVEVIAYHHKWVDEDFNPNGTRVGFLSDEGFISAFWWDYQDCYETISKSHCENNKDFYSLTIVELHRPIMLNHQLYLINKFHFHIQL